MWEVLGGVNEAAPSDLNNAKKVGVTYYWTTGIAHTPFDYGNMINIMRGNNGSFWQLAGYRLDTDEQISIRYYNPNNSSFGAWRRIDNFGCNTARELASLLGVKQYPVHLYTIESGNEKTVLCGYGLLIGLFPGGPQTMVSLVNNNNLTAISGSVSNLTFTRVTEYNLKITNSAASKVYIVIINNRVDE